MALLAAYAACAFSQAVAVPGAALAEQLAWLQANAVSNTHYLIEINGNVDIAPQHVTVPGNRRNVTVTLRADGQERTISLYGDGSLFTVASGVTLVLDGTLTLRGAAGNNRKLVLINDGAALVMNTGSGIAANTGGAVGVNSGGAFTMYGGAIFDNTGSLGGEGRHVLRGGIGGIGAVTNWGTFAMYDGTISGNTGGGGVKGGAGAVANWGRFTMYGGAISGNAGGEGDIGGSGAVFNAGIFTLYSGTIAGNSGGSGGGNLWGIRGGIGAVNNSGAFIMRGGVISGNSGGAEAGSDGWGGVGGVSNSGRFFMYDGTISGNSGGGSSGFNDSGPWDGWDGVGAVFNVGAFTMHGGTIAANNGGIGNWSVRHGTTSYGIFRITGGIIYGNDAAANVGNPGGTLRIFGVLTTAQFGTFNNVGLFVSAGTLTNTNNTIHVVNGVLR